MSKKDKTNTMSNLVSKYNISEKDLYALGIIETQKKNVGFLQKENLKAASLKILKPYNVKFMDLGALMSELKRGGFDIKYAESVSNEDKLEIQKLIQENSNASNFYAEWWSGKTKKQKWVIIIAVLFVFGLIGQLTEPKKQTLPSANSSVNTNSQSEEDSKKAYRAGYFDGERMNGEPNPPSYDYFVNTHPELSDADKLVYKMGYDDGVLGRTKQY